MVADFGEFSRAVLPSHQQKTKSCHSAPSRSIIVLVPPTHRQTWRITWALAALCLTPALALAHALLMESTPKQDESLKTPATQAVLRFDAKIEKQVTRVTLVDGNGQKVKLPPLPEDKDGPQDQLTIPFPTLKPGDYQLQYTVLAADGHTTIGVLQFRVNAAATKPTTIPAAAGGPR
jgi:methionine-rich copper-binding protein CopC